MSREYLIKGFEDKDVQHYYRYMVTGNVIKPFIFIIDAASK
jgi:hypothetical protein